MTGGEGGLQLHYGLGAGPFSSGIEHRSRFTLKVGPASLLSCPASLLSCTPVTLLSPALKEDGWFVLNSGVPVPATKAQFMEVLSDIEVGPWRVSQ